MSGWAGWSKVTETSAVTLGQILLLNKILIFNIFLSSLGRWPGRSALGIGGGSSFSQLFKALFAWFVSLVAASPSILGFKGMMVFSLHSQENPFNPLYGTPLGLRCSLHYIKVKKITSSLNVTPKKKSLL